MPVVPFFDLQLQYHTLKNEIDTAIAGVLQSGKFVGGEVVEKFESELAQYVGMQHAISCGNGTDALMLSLLATTIPKGSSIIIPTFNYIAASEVATLLGYNIIFADVCSKTFNINIEQIKKVYTKDVKAIIVTHLFGQVVEDIETIYEFCVQHNIVLIEDVAQSIGAEKNIGRDSIITTSFFPTKNLACYGDGGAVLTNNAALAMKIKKLANHGQSKKYYHELVGINSRLDAIQATILSIKIKYLDNYINRKRCISSIYDECFKNIKEIEIPMQKNNHSFHQYTIKVANNKRDDLQQCLKNKNIDTAVYYPLCTHQQLAYKQNVSLKNAEALCSEVLSLPIFPELLEEQAMYVGRVVLDYFV